MMDDIMSADIVCITKKFEQLFFRRFMKCCTIMTECPNIMDFMIFQTNFNIYYGITYDIKWHRSIFIVDYMVGVLIFSDSYKSAPY